MNTLRLTLTALSILSCTVAGADDGQLRMLVFVSETCPHCEAQKPFIASLDRAHDSLQVEIFEVRNNAENRQHFQRVARAHGATADSVPAVFVGGRVWFGDSEPVRRQVAGHVEHCLQVGGCADSGETERPFESSPGSGEQARLDLPVVGTIDLMLQPLIVSTGLIALVDGFNPCSLWVLTILLALVIHSGSRRRILIVGSTFLLVTAVIYGLFIAGVYGALSFMLIGGWIHWLVALLALVFAVVNIKDYFWFQRGVSFTIDERHKPGIYRRIRGLISSGNSTTALIAATTLMAAGIAFIELPCTAGFPVIWSGILASHQVDWLQFSFLLALYLTIYLGIELVVFIIALTTLRVDRFEERHGRMLKLIGGVIMLALAVVLIAAPELMNDLRGALGVFGAAIGITAAVLVFHRVVLPKFGVHLGDEWR